MRPRTIRNINKADPYPGDGGLGALPTFEEAFSRSLAPKAEN